MAGKNIKVALQITADLNQARLAIQGLNNDLSRITGGMHDLRTSQTTISRSIADTNAGVQRLSSNFNQQNQAIRQLIATTAAYFSVNKLMGEADAYTSLHNKLKLVTEVQDNAAQSQINLKTALGDTFKIAQSAAADWGGVSSIYDKIYKNSERLNLSQKQVASITETVTKSISNSGSSAQAASAALYQLGQSFDKGSLNGDEFVSISENAGYVMDVLAKGLGVTRAELRQMSTDGKLTTDAMVTAFTNMHDKVNNAFGSTQTTIGGGFTMVSNALKQYVGEADQGVGATKFLVNALSGVANNFSDVINVMGLAAWGVFTQKLIAQATAMKNQITVSQTNRAALLSELQATVTATTAEVSRTHALMQLTQWKLADARADMARMSGMQRLTFMQQVVLPLERQLTAATAAHTAAQTAEKAATDALTAAKSRLAIAGRAVLGFLGGPVGLLVTGLSVASMYLMMRDSSDEATKSMASQIGTVAELSKQYKQLSFTKLSAEMATIREDMKKAESDVKDALSGVSGVVKSYSVDMPSQKQTAWKEIVDQVKKNKISTDQALLSLSQSEFKFSKSDLADAAQYFEKINEGRTKLETYNQQLRLGEQLLGSVNDQFDKHNKNIDSQASQINVLESEYSRLNNSFQTHIDYAKENAANNGIVKSSVDEINQTLEQYSAGTISATKVAQVFAKSGKVSPDVLKSFTESAQKVDLSKKALDEANTAFKRTQENAPKTAKGFDEIGMSIQGIGTNAKDATNQIANMSKGWQDFTKNAKQNIFANTMQNYLMQKGYSETVAKELTNARIAKGVNLTPQDTQLVLSQVESQKQIESYKEKQRKQEEAITKEKEKQKKFQEGMNRLVGLVGSTGGSTGNHLDIRYDRSYSSGAISAEHMARFQLGGKTLNPKNSNSPYGMRTHPISGERKLHRGYDFRAPAGTEVTTSYPIKDVKTFWDTRGGGWTSQVIFEDGVVVNLLHQLPKMKERIKGGSSKGKSQSEQSTDTYNLFVDQQDEQKQKFDNQKSIEEKYFTEDKKRLTDHLKSREDILKAGFSREKELELLLAEDKRYNTEANKPRLDMLKSVQDSMTDLESTHLRMTGQDLQAELNDVDQKYKDLKTKIETLLQNTTNPTERMQLEEAQLKLKVVIDKEKMTVEFNNTMQRLEQLQSLRQQRQDTLKLQFDSGQIQQPQYAQGLKAIDFEMQPQLLKLVDTARDLAAKLDDAFSVAKIENFAASLTQVDLESKKFLPTLDQIQEKIAGGMTDAIMSWVDGTQSASDAFRQFAADFLREIAQMILKQMIFNAVKAASSFMGYADGGLVTGFSSGGYTGAGGKYQEAGIVHKDEFVIRKESTSQAGAKEFLTYFNRYGMAALNNFKGYADGGLVAAPAINVPNIQAPQLTNPTEQIANSTSFSANQQFLLVDDPSRLSDYIRSGEGQETLVVMMSRDPAKFKAALKIGN